MASVQHRKSAPASPAGADAAGSGRAKIKVRIARDKAKKYIVKADDTLASGVAAGIRRVLHGRAEVSPVRDPQENVLDFPRDLPVIIEFGGKVTHPFEGRTEAGGRLRFTSAAALPIQCFQRQEYGPRELIIRDDGTSPGGPLAGGGRSLRAAPQARTMRRSA